MLTGLVPARRNHHFVTIIKRACSEEQAQEKREGEDWPEGVTSQGILHRVFILCRFIFRSYHHAAATNSLPLDSIFARDREWIWQILDSVRPRMLPISLKVSSS